MEWMLSITAVLLTYGVVIYNRLVSDNNRVLQAWSDISVQLKRRHDLIPKLVTAVKAYANYENSILREVTHQRRLAAEIQEPEQTALTEQHLERLVQRMMVVAEAYPQLKADRQYLELMAELSEVENQIQYARRFYNGAVRNLNVRIDSFPDVTVAGLFRFRRAQFFDASPIGQDNGGAGI